MVAVTRASLSVGLPVALLLFGRAVLVLTPVWNRRAHIPFPYRLGQALGWVLVGTADVLSVVVGFTLTSLVVLCLGLTVAISFGVRGQISRQTEP